VTAVAVWNHRPSADELLQQRLASGWQPTATVLQEGERILGHAACLVDKSAPAAQKTPLVLRSLLSVWLLAAVLFAHGCHGEHDEDLFASLFASPGVSACEPLGSQDPRGSEYLTSGLVDANKDPS
jgi:hypothetical protein